MNRSAEGVEPTQFDPPDRLACVCRASQRQHRMVCGGDELRPHLDQLGPEFVAAPKRPPFIQPRGRRIEFTICDGNLRRLYPRVRPEQQPRAIRLNVEIETHFLGEPTPLAVI